MKKNRKILIGYTTGVFDLFHIGHLNILSNAKSLCDKLIVGVTIDKLVKYKFKKTIIPFKERCKIVESIKYVDCVVPQVSHNKLEAYRRYKFDIMFVGDDWYKSKNWKIYEKELKKYSVKIIYFPYTKGTSSTLINNTLIKLRK